MKRLLSLLLAAILVWSTIPNLSAIEMIPIEGTTTPAVISVDVPTALSFSISDSQFTTVPVQIVNRGQAPVDIGLLKITATVGNPAKVVEPDAHDWEVAGTDVTTHNIALGIEVDGATYWSPPEHTPLSVPDNEFTLKALETKPVKLSARHGRSWPETVTLDYRMTLTIRLHDSYGAYIKFTNHAGSIKDIYFPITTQHRQSIQMQFSVQSLVGNQIKSIVDAPYSVHSFEYPGGYVQYQMNFQAEADGECYLAARFDYYGSDIPDVNTDNLLPFEPDCYIYDSYVNPADYGIQLEHVHYIIATDEQGHQKYLRIHVALVQKK